MVGQRPACGAGLDQVRLVLLPGAKEAVTGDMAVSASNAAARPFGKQLATSTSPLIANPPRSERPMSAASAARKTRRRPRMSACFTSHEKDSAGGEDVACHTHCSKLLRCRLFQCREW